MYDLQWKCQIAVLLQYFWSKCITKLKVISNEHPSLSLQNVKKPAEECSFLRSYLVATCSFTKNATPWQVFFHCVLTKHVTVIKLTVFVIFLLLTNTIFVVIILYKWSVFLVFRRKGIFYDSYSTRWFHFSHSFF